jgi:predicted membrane channel-forming protein YqfA (hemolysin III family)
MSVIAHAFQTSRDKHCDAEADIQTSIVVAPQFARICVAMLAVPLAAIYARDTWWIGIFGVAPSLLFLLKPNLLNWTLARTFFSVGWFLMLYNKVML